MMKVVNVDENKCNNNCAHSSTEQKTNRQQADQNARTGKSSSRIVKETGLPWSKNKLEGQPG